MIAKTRTAVARDPQSSTGSPESFGWLRRSELDQPEGLAWERPNGDIVFHPRSEDLVIGRAAAPPQATPVADQFVHQSTLTAMVLHAARIEVPGIASLVLEYAKPDIYGINWRVAGIGFGSATMEAAREAVVKAASIYRLFIVMVPDDDPRGLDQ